MLPCCSCSPILELFGSGWPSRVCGIVGAASMAALGVMWWSLRRRLAPDQAQFEGARSRDADVMAYVVSYVVPFAAVADKTDGQMRIALALFAVLIAVLYLRSAVFYVHPLLLMFGVHAYEPPKTESRRSFLTHQRHLRQTCNLRVVSIGLNVYVDTPA